MKSGTVTINGKDGADWTLKRESKLPDYYIEYKEAEKLRFKNFLGNLRIVAPDRMITRSVYNNRNGHLPSKEGRFWYEADINYKGGFRNGQRIIYSNDGLIFFSYDWDCLDGLFYERENFSVELHRFYSMKKELQDECKLMLEVFDDVHNETPNFTYKTIS